MSEPVPVSSVAPRRLRPAPERATALGPSPATTYDAILERAFTLAETGSFVSLASLKQQLKAEGFVAVETALRGIHDRRRLRALCRTVTRGGAPS